MKNLFLVLVLLGLSISPVFSAKEKTVVEDPFEPSLPKQEKPGDLKPVKGAATAPNIAIQGVLWNSDVPQVIIDGDVYKAGDKLKTVDAKIYKIDKNRVFIFYEGRLYDMGVAKKTKRGAQ
ncbi:MAG: hypothetical protein WCI77_01580 [Candidatus Omnitrophota bacterium]